MYRILICLLCTFLVACSSSQQNIASGYDPLINTMLNPQAIKAKYGFETLLSTTDNFTFFTLLRSSTSPANNHTLHVYIEGDGFAWKTRTMPSSDPTPTTPTAFNIAKRDPSKNAVLYLARPCQYIMNLSDSKDKCQQKYWTSHRYSLEVVEAMNKVVDIVKEKTLAKDVVLVGYSGGGAIGALMASTRNDVVFLGTIAANLDIATWTKHHNVSPLTQSQNPLHIVHKIKHIPQKHVMSTNDDIVPPMVNKSFCEALPKPESCIILDTTTHYGEWESLWKYEYR